MMDIKCGFVTLAGPPNAGKSTLLNRLLREPLAIVSPRPQTTWNVVRGILTESRGQVIFVDTPGLHDPRDDLGVHMVRAARGALSGVNLIYWLEDCRKNAKDSFLQIKEYLPDGVPSLLILNKVDLIPRSDLLPLIDHFARLNVFREIIPLSALSGENVDALLELTWRYLPEGSPLFPTDQLSDQPERVLIREFIREQVFLHTRQEIPYSSAVKIEEIHEESARKKIYIRATIYAERESQRGMLVGKGGVMIKRIGTAARRRVEKLLGRPVFLELRVKVRKKWRKNKASLREFGFTE